MNDIEKRAHDITVAILPRMIDEDNLSYYASTDGVHPFFNAQDIIDEYRMIYEELLTELQDQER